MSPDWSAGPEPVPYSSLDNPQSFNLYSYAGNNPLSIATLTVTVRQGLAGSAARPVGLERRYLTLGSASVMNSMDSASILTIRFSRYSRLTVSS